MMREDDQDSTRHNPFNWQLYERGNCEDNESGEEKRKKNEVRFGEVRLRFAGKMG